MNKNKKIIGIFSTVLLIISLFWGCSSKEFFSNNKEEKNAKNT